ncbi:hypothetical protein D3OALGB2SA_2498 [Olavius algarvensis associated proteobacterium Delta 3]|nr:hypothetical protein D3OALGB2SA_2498 [Olavius algarvensis associated proteobacterium Delta 3]
MKKVIALAVITLLWSPVSLASGVTLVQTVEVRKGLNAYQYQLDNGLTVVLIPNQAAPLTTICHWVKAGSLHETPGVTGIAHLFEHMMFRPLKPGTPSFFERAARLGVQVNANTRFGSTVFTSTVPQINLEQMLKLEADRFTKLVVTPELLRIEKEAVRSEYSTKFDADPVFDLWYSIYVAGFPGHPYGWMIIGFREDLDNISAADCNAFFKKYYTAKNTGLFIGGNFDHNDVLEIVVRYYGEWTPGVETALPEAYQHKEDGYIFKSGRIVSQSPMLLAGYRIPEYDGENHLLLKLADHILFDSDYSLAKDRLMYEKKVVSSIDSFNFDYDRSMLKAMMLLMPGVSIKSVVHELNELPNDFRSLSDEEFSTYLREFQIEAAEAMFRNMSLVSLLSLSWGKFGDIRHITDLAREPASITKAALQTFIDTYVTKNNMVVVMNKSE